MHDFMMGFELLIPLVVLTGMIVITIVAIYSNQKRREREAYYRHELAKQVVARGGDAEELARVFMQEKRALSGRKVEAMKLGGLVLVALGVGAMVLLLSLAPDVWAAGVTPALLGGVLFLYGLYAERRSDDA